MVRKIPLGRVCIVRQRLKRFSVQRYLYFVLMYGLHEIYQVADIGEMIFRQAETAHKAHASKRLYRGGEGHDAYLYPFLPTASSAICWILKREVVMQVAIRPLVGLRLVIPCTKALFEKIMFKMEIRVHLVKGNRYRTNNGQ